MEDNGCKKKLAKDQWVRFAEPADTFEVWWEREGSFSADKIMNRPQESLNELKELFRDCWSNSEFLCKQSN